MRFVPVFVLETHDQTNNKCLPKFVKTHNASSSITTTIHTSRWRETAFIGASHIYPIENSLQEVEINRDRMEM